MTKNIITSVQERLHLDPIFKMDPNKPEGNVVKNKLVQAALPAVLVGMFKATRTDAAAAALISNVKQPWLQRIFGNKAGVIVDKVASYAHEESVPTGKLMEKIAATAYSCLETQKEGGLDPASLKDLLTLQRHEILTYLPPQLDMGHLVNEPVIDDQTNKMEGPVSNLMHKIGNKFSGGGQ